MGTSHTQVTVYILPGVSNSKFFCGIVTGLWASLQTRVEWIKGDCRSSVQVCTLLSVALVLITNYTIGRQHFLSYCDYYDRVTLWNVVIANYRVLLHILYTICLILLSEDGDVFL